MESSELFSSLLQNPEVMRQLTGLASELIGGGLAGAPADKAPDPPAPPISVPAEPASFAEPAAPPPSSSDPAAELMQKAMPALSAIAQSGRRPASPDRIRLLSALKPFVSAKTSAQIDHAERILSMARMTKTAAEQFLPQLSDREREV